MTYEAKETLAASIVGMIILGIIIFVAALTHAWGVADGRCEYACETHNGLNRTLEKKEKTMCICNDDNIVQSTQLDDGGVK